MRAALCSFDLRIPGCSSLKEKRHVVQSLKDRLRNKFNVSVAEIDHQDTWQRATLAAVTVASRSSADPPLMRTPVPARRPSAAMTAAGVARIKAQGQATTSTASAG